MLHAVTNTEPLATASGKNQSNHIAQVSNITQEYNIRSGGSVVALKDTSISIKENEFVTLVGPSGCGKSTLLKLIGGIIPPSRGTVMFAGKPLRSPSREIGMVFQRPILLPWRSVLDNVLFPIEMLGWSVSEYEQKARDLLDLVGLKGFEKVLPIELSGGM